METKKAILLVRVSTNAQDYDEQERELQQMAVRDGFAPEDIIHIAEKESGAKLTEEQRKGLNRMKEVIATEDVGAVYAWEISRIARRKKILFNILDLLQVRKIQLVIKEPSIRMLDANGNVDYAAETIFTLFAQMAESEMRTKVARFRRTKKEMALQAKWIGGFKPKFGYTIDENRNYIINEPEAEVIRLAFRLYTTTDMGYIRLSREMATYGHKIVPERLTAIITDPAYMGESPEKVCQRKRGDVQLHRRWPIIIDPETWHKAERKRKAGDQSNKSSRYMFGAHLVVCKECGRHFVAYSSSGTYQCVGHNIYRDCKSRSCILINALDSILWDDAKQDYINDLVADREGKVREYEQQIADLHAKIAAAQKTVDTVTERLSKVGENYEIGLYDRETAIRKRDEINASAQEAKGVIATLTANIENFKRLIANMADAESVIDRFNRVAEGVDNIDDIRRMYEIVHTYIKKVEVVECPILGVKCTKKITITNVDGSVSVYYFMYHRKKGFRYWHDPYLNVRPEVWERLVAEGKNFIPLDDGSGEFVELERIKRKKRYVRVTDR